MKKSADKALTTVHDALREEAETRAAITGDINEADYTSKSLLHELQVHQIELEMQNEQLRLTQIELEQSRDRYWDLYEFAPVGYLTIDNQGIVVEANLKATVLLGVERKKLLQHSFSLFLHADDQDQWYRLIHRIKLFHPDAEINLDLRLSRSKGEMLYANLNCLRLKENDQQHLLRLTLIDISKAKQEEVERLNREIMLRNALVREVHHHIKNSLQGISGLLHQQCSAHPELYPIIQKATRQLETIASVHGLQGINPDSVVILQKLLQGISSNYEILWHEPLMLSIPSQIPDLNIKQEETVPIALVINELVSNATKHATKMTTIDISLESDSVNDTAIIIVANHGELTLNPENPMLPKEGNGLKLIQTLLPRHGATLSWQQTGGIVFTRLTLSISAILSKMSHDAR